jgi:hypothetical protein
MGQPGSHQFPVVEVGGKEEGGACFEATEFFRIDGTDADCLLMSAMDKAKKIECGVLVESKAEPKGVGEPTEAGIDSNRPALPAYYNKAEYQRQGEGIQIEFIRFFLKQYFLDLF